MNGETTKYYKYKNSSGKASIPLAMAKGLNWKHLDELNIVFDVRNGQKGLFLFKKED